MENLNITLSDLGYILKALETKIEKCEEMLLLHDETDEDSTFRILAKSISYDLVRYKEIYNNIYPVYYDEINSLKELRGNRDEL